MDVQHVVAGVNCRHGFDLVLRGRFETGLQGGAWRVTDAAGNPAVLKYWPGAPRNLAATIDRLRARGYPTPRWLAEGRIGEFAYCVQQFATGRPASPITAPSVEGILAVLDKQTGLAPNAGRHWNAEVSRMAELGRNVTGRYTELMGRFDRIELTVGDLVHGDFNSANILLADEAADRVSAVIDVDNLGRGSRVVDYACLLRESYVEGYGPAVSEPILDAGLAVAGPGPLALAATAAAHFIVGFKRQHEPHRLPEVLDRLDRMAADISRRT